ncbi:MAG TPA: DUF5666 domain-containing protein, partial [Armatimonadota bacterium]
MKRATLASVMGVLCLLWAATAFAQNPGRQPGMGFGGGVTGVVTAIKDNAITVLTQDSKDPVTVNLTAETRITKQATIKVADLKVGEQVMVFGRSVTDTAGTTSYEAMSVMAGESMFRRAGGGAGGPGGGGGGGNRPGGFAPVTGKVKSVSPLVVTADDGTDTTVTVTEGARVMRNTTLTPADIKVGEEIRAMGQRSDTGEVQATMIMTGIDPPARVGTVAAFADGVLEITPASGGASAKVAVSATVPVYRQSTLQESDLKVGDKVSVRARQTQGSDSTAIASMITLGDPLPNVGGMGRGMFGGLGARPGGGAPGGPGPGGAGPGGPGGRMGGNLVTGEITKLSPLTIKTDQGEREFTLSGQTRIV